jgi:hypothetical protein
VPSDTVKPHLDSSFKALEFGRRSMLISRAVDTSELMRQFSPPEFVAWADGKNLKLPKKLQEAVARVRGVNKIPCEVDELRRQLEECKAACKDTHPRELQSLLRILAGMAAGRYNFNPKADRTSATKAIVDDIERLGLSIDKDTVLKYLRRAFNDLEIDLPCP